MSSKNNQSDKIKRSAKALKSTPSASKKSLPKEIVTRSKMPDLSPVNIIEQISKMLREEVHNLERKKAVGE